MSAVDEARRRLAEATPEAEWSAFAGVNDSGEWMGCGPVHYSEDPHEEVDIKGAEHDANLIAAAPRLLRALCEEVDRLRTELETRPSPRA